MLETLGIAAFVALIISMLVVKVLNMLGIIPVFNAKSVVKGFIVLTILFFIAFSIWG